MRSGIDIVVEVYKMINTPALVAALGGDYIWQHNWPQNSSKTEVCISIPLTDAYESRVRFFDIDIRTPNLGTKGKPEVYPFPGEPQDNTFPDLAKLKQVTDIVLPLIESSGDLYVETIVPGVPRRDSDGNWIVNIRVEFTLLDAQDTHNVTIQDKTATDDGYGGHIPVITDVWSGVAQRVDIIRSPSLREDAGVYGLYMRCSWLVPRDELTPEKDMRVVATDGNYVITGIFPEGVFWRLTTTKKDKWSTLT